ncbi:MAG TPA: tyrosine-type recombinase/integrase, partial [Anaerolineales bacterium]|nr:tyrosine-type recombinase/integrase [Anaerolineales bacterium]
MNRFTFTQVVEGYLLAANARHLSPHTIKDYTNTYRKFLGHLDDDPIFVTINSKLVEDFFRAQQVSNKTILNYHTGLSALWTWAVEEQLATENILHKVKRPKPEKRVIQPYSHMDIKAMLSAVGSSVSYTRPGKRESAHSLATAERNKAIIYLLLDTGLRAAEICSLLINQVDVRNRRIIVMGKGSKERILPFSARTGQVLWRYLATRKEASAGDHLFTTQFGDPVERNHLLKCLIRIGERAGVEGVNVHRFRH